MRNTILTLSAVTLVAGSALAQSDYTGPATVVFAMNNTVRLASTNTNDGAIIGDDGVMYFSPGGSMPFAIPYCDYGTWNAFFGDEDNNNAYGDSAIGAIDAVHVPLAAPSPASFFDIYFSIQTPTGSAGFLGAPVSDGDVIRLVNTGSTTGIETLISQAQIISAMNSTSTNVDVVAFTIDEIGGGDMYFSFTATVDVNGVNLEDGGILRIPASALTYTGGVVSAVTPGSAEIVLTEAEVAAMFVNAGYMFGASDVTGICVDPTLGTFTSSVTNKTMPHFWLCDDDSADEGFVSTKNNPVNSMPGVVPTVNFVPMIGAAAFGLSGGFSGPSIGDPFGMAFQFTDPTGPTPMHIDSFPTYQTPLPATFQIDVTGGTPNGAIVLLFDLMALPTGGLYPARIPISPLGTFFGPSWREYYPNLPSLGTLLLITDSEGFARQPLNIPPGFSDFGAILQAGDITTLTLSAPCLINWD
ncbi:MAG: hypothetical protein KDE27_00410 [Planctomycetes bacterium]|nr:hypothetical protein [Planctomycetota bacterium]